MNERGRAFVDRYVTKGWRSATMKRGKGTLGEIFSTLTPSSRPIQKRIFGGGGLEWKHPKNPQKRTTSNSLFFSLSFFLSIQ